MGCRESQQPWSPLEFAFSLVPWGARECELQDGDDPSLDLPVSWLQAAPRSGGMEQLGHVNAFGGGMILQSKGQPSVAGR